MRERWREVTTQQLVIFTAGLGAFVWLLATDADGFIPVLDHANQWLHKAAHLVCELFVPQVSLYAGVTTQLLVPLLTTFGFWKEAETLPCAISGTWFCENLLNIAAYMTDAATKQMPMMGGAHYEWEELFSRLGVTTPPAEFAPGPWLAGWAGIAFLWLWVVRRWWRQRQRY